MTFHAAGLGATQLAVQAGALALALALAAALARPTIPPAAPLWAAAAALLATALLGPPYEAMSRWVPLGPLQLHVGFLTLPAAAVALPWARTTGELVPAAVIALALALQPDASLAAAWLAATLVAARRLPLRHAGLALLPALVATAVAIARDVQLPPVPHVEGVFALALGVQPMLALVLGAALAWTVLAPARRNPTLTALLAVAAAAPLFGAWPVPFAGYGASPIVGLGVATALTVTGPCASDTGACPSA